MGLGSRRRLSSLMPTPFHLLLQSPPALTSPTPLQLTVQSHGDYKVMRVKPTALPVHTHTCAPHLCTLAESEPRQPPGRIPGLAPACSTLSTVHTSVCAYTSVPFD